VGCQRENNEDSFIYWEPEDDTDFKLRGRLAVVADGMGGTEGGQFASHIAVDSVQRHYAAASQETPQQNLLEGFRIANAAVKEKARQEPHLHGMGTTLTAAAILDRSLYFAHVGDSRIYLWRSGVLQKLTRDHSLVGRLVESGLIRPEDAETHPQRHVLTTAVGVAESIEPDSSAEPIPLCSGDILLICTDGLWGQMSETEIAQNLSSGDVSAAGTALVQLAKEHGGPDNITLQLLKIS
jgi:protein phosphatase